jgi:hypothetical protein
MHSKLLIAIGSVITTAIITTITVATANPTPAKTCFMQTENGQTIDLSQICDQSSPARFSGVINPNAPAEIVLPSRDRPSAMWQSIPDAPTAPIAGSTYPQPAIGTIQSIPGSAANPVK